jgi:hypothetical protein
MEEKRTERQPATAFGRAVKESGFSAVCPRCGKKWSDRKTWIADSIDSGRMISAGDFYEKTREHRDCGGINFYPRSFQDIAS